MASDNRATIRISGELASKLDNRRGEATRTDFAIEMIEQGLDCATTIKLDETEKQQFFKHLTGGKGKEYQEPLISLELTERELIEMAIAKSGKRYDDLLKEALLTYCKEQITYAARRDHIDQTTHGSPETRLQKAFAELTEMAFNGQYTPRGGKVNLSAIAQRAGVNYNSAKRWAQANQPELLEKNG